MTNLPGDFLSSAAFMLCVVAASAGPLIAPNQRHPQQHRPAWAHSPTQARRIARQARQKDIRP
jgi:hypothetical protein